MSATTDRHHDFDLIAIGQSDVGEGAARHDLTVAFQCDALAGISQLFDQFGDIERGGESASLAIDT